MNAFGDLHSIVEKKGFAEVVAWVRAIGDAHRSAQSVRVQVGQEAGERTQKKRRKQFLSRAGRDPYEFDVSPFRYTPLIPLQSMISEHDLRN